MKLNNAIKQEIACIDLAENEYFISTTILMFIHNKNTNLHINITKSILLTYYVIHLFFVSKYIFLN